MQTPIMMKVVELALEHDTWSADASERAALVLALDDACEGVKGVRLFLTMKAGEPSPFQLGQRVPLVLGDTGVALVDALGAETLADA